MQNQKGKAKPYQGISFNRGIPDEIFHYILQFFTDAEKLLLRGTNHYFNERIKASDATEYRDKFWSKYGEKIITFNDLIKTSSQIEKIKQAQLGTNIGLFWKRTNKGDYIRENSNKQGLAFLGKHISQFDLAIAGKLHTLLTEEHQQRYSQNLAMIKQTISLIQSKKDEPSLKIYPLYKQAFIIVTTLLTMTLEKMINNETSLTDAVADSEALDIQITRDEIEALTKKIFTMKNLFKEIKVFQQQNGDIFPTYLENFQQGLNIAYIELYGLLPENGSSYIQKQEQPAKR